MKTYNHALQRHESSAPTARNTTTGNTTDKKTLSDLYDWIFESRSREMKFYAVASAVASVMVIMLIAAPAMFFTIAVAAAVLIAASAVQKRADEHLSRRGHAGSATIKTMQ